MAKDKPKRPITTGEEIANAITHGIGLLLQSLLWLSWLYSQQ
jgi:hypothetical protein